MSAVALMPRTRELRTLLEPFTRSAGLVDPTLRVDRMDLHGAAMRSWPIDDGRYEMRSNGDIEKLGPMLQATRAFTANYGGERVRIDENTRVAVGHEIARTHPNAFVPVGQPGAAARSRSATSTRQTTRPEPKPARAAVASPPEQPRHKVELRDTQSRTTVRVGSFAYTAIQEECLRMAPFQTLETGGLLAARTTQSWDTQMHVVDARGPGPKTQHRANAMRIDLDGADQLEREFAYAEAGIAEVGMWHTHPRGDATPSPDDLQTLADSLRYVSDRRGSGVYLGLIATPGRHGSWHFPRLAAYVVRRGERNNYVCQPALVKIAGQS